MWNSGVASATPLFSSFPMLRRGSSAPKVKRVMSSDNVKENASVVDLSGVEWSHDTGNSDEPESSSCKFNKDTNTTRADKVRRSHSQIGNPTGTGVENLHNKKYFIIKSLSHQNIRLSMEKGIWATQIMNEPILDEAFHNSDCVILIFSVNMSGAFQGYAQMKSSIGGRRDNVWREGSGKSNPWGRSFKVKWLCLNDLPFHETLHLKNPLNEYKPVKISRDCQELSPDIGLALCELLDAKNNADGLLTGSSRYNFSLKDHANTPSSMGYSDCNLPSLHLPWSMPLPYSSLFYPNQAEAKKNYSSNQRFDETMYTGVLPITSESSKVAGIKRSHFDGQISKPIVDKDVASGFGAWDLSSKDPLACILTEDDFLDMSYEEYLEVHSRFRKQFCSSVSETKPSRKKTKPSRKETKPSRKEAKPSRKEAKPSRKETKRSRKRRSRSRRNSYANDDRNLGEVDSNRSNSNGRMHQSSLPRI